MSDQANRIGQEQGAQKTDPTALTTDALQREIAQVRELLETKIGANDRVIAITYAAVERQLAFLESQRQEQKADTKQAVDAALAAAKEAVTITANNTKEQIAALSTSFATTMSALSDKLDDVKSSVGDLGGMKKGAIEGRAQMSDALKLGISLIGAVILLVGFFIAQNGP